MNFRAKQLQTDLPAVLPSMLLCDFGNLEREIRTLEAAGARCLHLDVMDGRFVPNFTYGMPIVQAVRGLTEMPLDVHLMIDDPQSYIQAFADAGADLITVHVEAVQDPRSVLEQIRGAGVAAGLACNPGTSLDTIFPALDFCDLVLIMSVDAGFGGQPFNPVALEKLRTLRQAAPALMLEVDGGVNEKTISACRQAGADLFVVGSAIFRAGDYSVAMRRLNQAARATSLE